MAWLMGTLHPGTAYIASDSTLMSRCGRPAKVVLLLLLPAIASVSEPFSVMPGQLCMGLWLLDARLPLQ